MESFSLSVIIPTYNEVYVIEDNLEKVYQYLKNRFYDFEIIVIDDGSTDNTYRVVLELSKKVKEIKIIKNNINYGKGYSIKKGIFFANLDYILFSDADLSTPIEEFDKFIKYIKKGEDVIIGSRAMAGSEIIKSQSFLRKNMGKIFNILVQIFVFRGIKDTQCGFKCFKKQVARDLFKLQKIKRFCFDVEILYAANYLGYFIREIPVKWVNNDKTRVSLIKDSLKMFLDLFSVKSYFRKLDREYN